VLDHEQDLAYEGGDHATQQTEDREHGHFTEPAEPVRGHGEQRAGACIRGMNTRGHARRHRKRNERARRELEEQQLDREDDRGKRRTERRGHTRGRARGEQNLALRRRHSQHLAEQRTEGTAGHDDRTLGTERTAGADRDRSRHRLRDGSVRLDATLSHEHRFHRFRDAVTFDDGRPQREQRHEQPAGHRGGNEPPLRVVVRERRQLPSHLVQERQVGQQRDRTQQDPRRAATREPEHDGQSGQVRDAPRRCVHIVIRYTHG
jgi:hypothetical protein